MHLLDCVPRTSVSSILTNTPPPQRLDVKWLVGMYERRKLANVRLEENSSEGTAKQCAHWKRSANLTKQLLGVSVEVVKTAPQERISEPDGQAEPSKEGEKSFNFCHNVEAARRFFRATDAQVLVRCHCRYGATSPASQKS